MALSLIPKPIQFWFLLSAVICCFDAFFVLSRPDSLKGGSLFWLFWPYENYYSFDTLYDMNEDTFVVIQSWLNIVESFFAVIVVLLSQSSCNKKKAVSSIVGVTIQAFIFWKTVIFVWYDHSFLTQEALSFSPKSILCYYLPSSVWLIMPLVSIWVIGKKIVQSLCAFQSDTKKAKNVQEQQKKGDKLGQGKNDQSKSHNNGHVKNN